MSKHTPGPWFQHRNGSSTVYIEAPIGGGLIQEVAACGPTEAGAVQQSANAKLIAAAPDLLEQLKIILSFCEFLSGSEDKPAHHPITTARSLIARLSDDV
ncbi:hypothetical protein KQCUZIGB_CDS0062 [Pectobacterium phage Ymer]|uniref:Uncharacterized protein n=1 Tax=Pectobacterium phage Koroua TaxID=3158138 RepID=A0AB39ABS8_9CAUD|nr:hypothetical protein Abuela_26 [Pectobacterium phage Abuela]WCD42815.1 hypothetical protein Ymer_45 [Pectobacterium phage Ymer]